MTRESFLSLPQPVACRPDAAVPGDVSQRRIDGLYLHIPFCFHKCHYCDFFSIVDHTSPATGPHPRGEDHQARFVSRLIKELEWRYRQEPLRPRTIFVGGGTPTLLRPPLWQRLLNALHACVDMTGVQEFTVEANPETVWPPLVEILVAGGVNRASIGAQSFHPTLLHTLERWHDPANVGRAVSVARTAGITNINLDLIFAIPGQTLAMLDNDLDAAMALGPDHLSCYGLTYEPHTALTARRHTGKITPVDQDLERLMFERVMDRLDQAGFEHYEISNWARPGRHCQHNLIYWRNQNWLALGPSAASHVDGHRWKNQPHLGRYLSQEPQPPMIDHEHLAPERRFGEGLMLMLRLRQGVPRQWLDDHLPHTDPRRTTIGQLVESGLLQWCDGHLGLTRDGLFVADAVISQLL